MPVRSLVNIFFFARFLSVMDSYVKISKFPNCSPASDSMFPINTTTLKGGERATMEIKT